MAGVEETAWPETDAHFVQFSILAHDEPGAFDTARRRAVSRIRRHGVGGDFQI